MKTELSFGAGKWRRQPIDLVDTLSDGPGYSKKDWLAGVSSFLVSRTLGNRKTKVFLSGSRILGWEWFLSDCWDILGGYSSSHRSGRTISKAENHSGCITVSFPSGFIIPGGEWLSDDREPRGWKAVFLLSQRAHPKCNTWLGGQFKNCHDREILFGHFGRRDMIVDCWILSSGSTTRKDRASWWMSWVTVMLLVIAI